MRRGRRAAVAAWGRAALLAGVTALVLVPILLVVVRALRGRDGSFSVGALVAQLGSGPTLLWFANSAVVSLAAVAIVLVVGAPAGYALARARGRGVAGSSVVLFSAQSLPVLVLMTPLYVLLVHVGGVDGLAWVTLLYVGAALAVAIWMLRSWFATMPIDAEEAAWLDGCSALGAFVRVVLPNARPALVSAGLFTFLLAWNDYWIALTFIQDQSAFTVGLALVSAGRTPALTVLALLPPLVAFLALHRWFRFGGTDPAALRG